MRARCTRVPSPNRPTGIPSSAESAGRPSNTSTVSPYLHSWGAPGLGYGGSPRPADSPLLHAQNLCWVHTPANLGRLTPAPASQARLLTPSGPLLLQQGLSLEGMRASTLSSLPSDLSPQGPHTTDTSLIFFPRIWPPDPRPHPSVVSTPNPSPDARGTPPLRGASAVPRPERNSRLLRGSSLPHSLGPPGRKTGHGPVTAPDSYFQSSRHPTSDTEEILPTRLHLQPLQAPQHSRSPRLLTGPPAPGLVPPPGAQIASRCSAAPPASPRKASARPLPAPPANTTAPLSPALAAHRPSKPLRVPVARPGPLGRR